MNGPMNVTEKRGREQRRWDGKGRKESRDSRRGRKERMGKGVEGPPPSLHDGDPSWYLKPDAMLSH